MLIIFVDVVRFEAKSVTSKRLIMRRIAFYPVGGERVSLPERHIKAYVDDYCHEFGQTDTDTKLMHLLYVADKGFDILSHIREFLDNHPEIAQDSIKQTLAYFVSHLRYPEGDRYVDDQFAMANYLKETLSLEKVLDLLTMEIRLRFSYTEDDKSVNFTQKYLRWDSLASLKKSLTVKSYSNELSIRQDFTAFQNQILLKKIFGISYKGIICALIGIMRI